MCCVDVKIDCEITASFVTRSFYIQIEVVADDAQRAKYQKSSDFSTTFTAIWSWNLQKCHSLFDRYFLYKIFEKFSKQLLKIELHSKPYHSKLYNAHSFQQKLSYSKLVKLVKAKIAFVGIAVSVKTNCRFDECGCGLSFVPRRCSNKSKWKDWVCSLFICVCASKCLPVVINKTREKLWKENSTFWKALFRFH